MKTENPHNSDNKLIFAIKNHLHASLIIKIETDQLISYILCVFFNVNMKHKRSSEIKLLIKLKAVNIIFFI